MADEALNSFTALLESVPGWIADLEGILKTATERQSEILLENQPADSPPYFSRKPLKSSSLRSRRSENNNPEGLRHSQLDSPEPTLLRPQLPHMTKADALRLAQRKRKTVSVCSGNRSGPSKYRSRSLVVIYYDGDVQKRFEMLVRAIGTCRNAIRKGKMGIKVDSLSRTGSSSSEASSSGGEDSTLDVGKLGYKSTRQRRTGGGLFGKNDGTEAFDKVDGLLEKGQVSCERAAHQVLRDGDCGPELNNAKEQFAEAETLAKAELPTLRKKVEKAIDRCRRSDERRQVEEETAEKNRQAASLSYVLLPHTLTSLPSDGKLEVDLEADDDSDDDIEADYIVNTLQLGKYQMRGSRLLAH